MAAPPANGILQDPSVARAQEDAAALLRAKTTQGLNALNHYIQEGPQGVSVYSML